MLIDQSTEFGQRVARRLQDEEVIWLVTTGPDMTPQPSPVWFLWDGETFLIFSQPGRPKLRNIAQRPRVALHLNSGNYGEDIVIFHGEAQILTGAPLANQVEGYITKYRRGIERIGMTPEQMAKEYSVAIRIPPTHLRGF